MAAQPPGQQAGQDSGADGPAINMGAGRMVRGTLTAVAPDRLTLKTEAGETWQVALTPNTRILKGRETARPTDAKIGDGIGAMGELDQPGKTVHALFVSLVDAEQVKKMRESLGKTWIAGKVTAIDELRLTILRSDKVTQIIAVDEDTSFKRGGRGMTMAMQEGGVSAPYGGGGRPRNNQPGNNQPGNARPDNPRPDNAGESITLADIKVGDSIAGAGTLKSGTFVPTELRVADPSQRRHRPGANGNESTPTEPN